MCDIGYIVRDHVSAVMQLLMAHTPQYNMQMITTKCLNTAVMLMYLFLGKKAFRYTGYCDVQTVHKRYSADGNQSLPVLERFKQELTSTRSTKRELYYVMLTDANVPSQAVPGSNVSARAATASAGIPTTTTYFPGHVFVIEKLPMTKQTNTSPEPNNASTNANRKPEKSKPPRFNLYQSYIQAYDLDGHISRNKGLACSYNRIVKDIIPGLEHIFRNPKWDDTDTAFWKRLTFVDGSKWKDTVFGGNVLFCYTKVSTNACVSKLRSFLEDNKAELVQKLLVERSVAPDDVYGMWRCTGVQQATPAQCYRTGNYSAKLLTNREMMSELDALLAKV